MKTVILAGGMGTRLAEETDLKPKPMVEIGGHPILWHIMMHYATHGFQEFAIAGGYKSNCIVKYFADYCTLHGNVTLRTGSGRIEQHDPHEQDWTIHVFNTGLRTQTGGRLKRLTAMVKDETFLMTWGDGVSNVDLTALVKFHRAHGRIATVTAVRPPSRFGHMHFDGDRVVQFSEKPDAAAGWINGAFFVLEPAVLDYIEGDETEWDRGPMVRLAADGQLMAYKHAGFWQCMDTLREKRILQRLWDSGEAPWKTWS